MSVCFVIPVMPRKINGFDYFKYTLEKNKSIFNSNNLCILINNDDKDILNPYLSDVNFKQIERVVHEELNIFQKETYEYWRSHLCADFKYCMSKATEIYPNCEYFVWLEDDVLIHPNFNNIFLNKPESFTWAQGGIGATCNIFSKEELTNIVIPKVQENYLNDIPLDWMYDFFSNRTNLSTKIAFHIGEISSRKDNQINRTNEIEEYNNLFH